MNALIDGYNLLHALGLANRHSPAKGLARARTRLLDWLADHSEGHSLRVIFDGQGNSRSSEETDHRGVKVRYSFQQTADEQIEEMLRTEHHPQDLVVVSNDRAVQDAARHSGFSALPCERFVDVLIAEPDPAVLGKPTPEESPPTEAEMAEWLDAFSQPRPRPPRRR